MQIHGKFQYVAAMSLLWSWRLHLKTRRLNTQSLFSYSVLQLTYSPQIHVPLYTCLFTSETPKDRAECATPSPQIPRGWNMPSGHQVILLGVRLISLDNK